MTNNTKKTWLITGCSTGLGRAFATMALAKGDSVAVASRNVQDVADIVQKYPDSALAVKLDVTRPAEIIAAIEATLARFGSIDVLVNNAGVGYFSSIEESDDADARAMMEVNFYGLANLTTAVLPTMRRQRSGHIINISSICGLYSYPGLGYYNATKYAVDGFSETLYREVKDLGIKVTIVAPGAFRTDWAGRSAKESAASIADYAGTATAFKKVIRDSNGLQPGNPVMAAEALGRLVDMPQPPLRLLLGADALSTARTKLQGLQQDFDTYEQVTLGTGF